MWIIADDSPQAISKRRRAPAHSGSWRLRSAGRTGGRAASGRFSCACSLQKSCARVPGPSLADPPPPGNGGDGLAGLCGCIMTHYTVTRPPTSGSRLSRPEPATPLSIREWAQATRMREDGEVMEEMRESHRGMVDGCRWNGGGMGYRDTGSLAGLGLTSGGTLESR